MSAQIQGGWGRSRGLLRAWMEQFTDLPELEYWWNWALSSPTGVLTWDNPAHLYVHSIVKQQDKLWLMAVWIVCHWGCGCCLSSPGVIYIVSTGKDQVSAGTRSKEKAVPWNCECEGEGKWVTACLCAGSFSGVGDHYILRLFSRKEAEGQTSEGEINLCE